MPASLGTEGVRLRYLMDAQIDGLLSTVYNECTQPPLLHNPFGMLSALVRGHACHMETGKLLGADLTAHVCNELARIGPPGSFIYAGERLS